MVYFLNFAFCGDGPIDTPLPCTQKRFDRIQVFYTWIFLQKLLRLWIPIMTSFWLHFPKWGLGVLRDTRWCEGVSCWLEGGRKNREYQSRKISVNTWVLLVHKKEKMWEMTNTVRFLAFVLWTDSTHVFICVCQEWYSPFFLPPSSQRDTLPHPVEHIPQ